MAKQREVPDREPTGAELWWNEHATLPTHGASGVGNVKADRAARGGKKPKVKKSVKQAPPGWTITIMVVAFVLFIAACFVVYLDIQRAQREGMATGRTTAAEERPSGRILNEPPSPDTIKRRLTAQGFEVGYLETVTDLRLLAYDAAVTSIDGAPARILAFKDEATTLKWVEGARQPVVYKDTWAISVPDEGLAGRMALKLKADLQGGQG